LLELLPIIQGLSGSDDEIEHMLTKDKDADPATVLYNGWKLATTSLDALSHLTGDSPESKSLSIVPLFYFYSNVGRYVRSSLYGFLAWLTSGGEDDVRTRKVVFSANRGRFEQVIFERNIPGAITDRVGSGSRATVATAKFYDRLLRLLDKMPQPVPDEVFQKGLKEILDELTAQPRLARSTRAGRQVSVSQKSSVNIRLIFEKAHRCQICGGILDLRAGSQYDHVVRFADGGPTETSNLRVTHPFCNNQRDAIEAHQKGDSRRALPEFSREFIVPAGDAVQLSLFGRTMFPD
jgi:hypothetical protein